MTRSITPHDLWNIARVGPVSVSRDGTGVVGVTTTDIETEVTTTRLHALTDFRPLTGDQSATNAAVSPDGSSVAFLRKIDDHLQVHVMAMAGGEPIRIGDFPRGVAGLKWLPDSSGLVVAADVFAVDPTNTAQHMSELSESKVSAKTTESRFYRHWDTWLTEGYVTHLFRLDLDGTSFNLTPTLQAFIAKPSNESASDQFDIAPDGSRLVLSAGLLDYGDLPCPRQELWSVPIIPGDTVGGDLTALTPDNPGDDVFPRFLPDGRLVFGAQAELDFYASPMLLTMLNTDGTQRQLAPGWQLSPSSWVIPPSGEFVLAVAEHRGRNKLYRVPLDGSEPTLFADALSLTNPAACDEGVYVLAQSLSQPPEVSFVAWYDGTVVRRSTFNDQLIAELDLGEVEEMVVAGARGDDIHTFIVYPPGFDSEKQWPLVHLIHGGPHGTFGDVWHQRWNAHAFAAPGYVLAMVNFHGSTSYGHDFTSSISGEWGDMPTVDVLSATDALVERGFVDIKRMAITGGSYGGYLTTWIATADQRFKCAIAHAAVTNLNSMYASDWTVGLGRAMGGEPWDNPVASARWSPSSHYANYVTPTLVIHGERDYRVPIDQGLELYGTLKAKGVEARLVYYPDENHWILRANNSLHWYSEVHAWLARYLT